MNWLCELSTTTCSSITEKKFKLSIEVFFLVVLIDIEIKDWFWCKWKNFCLSTTPLLIIFYSFYLFVNNILIFFILYPQKMSKNVDFTGFLKIKYGHLQAKWRWLVGKDANIRGWRSGQMWDARKIEEKAGYWRRKRHKWAKKKADIGPRFVR